MEINGDITRLFQREELRGFLESAEARGEAATIVAAAGCQVATGSSKSKNKQ